MQIKIKKLHKDAKIPRYAKPGDAGMDLFVTERSVLDMNHWEYKFGIAMEIPKGYVGLIFPRSSVYKTGLSLSNCVGILDSGYRGEIKAVFNMTVHGCTPYGYGDRAAQIIIMPYPEVEFEEVEELSETERGSGGFGSSGK